MKSIALILIICLCFIPIASAVSGISENFTITAADTETNITKPLPEEFYGNAVYSDNSPIPKGSIITVTNQDGIAIGNFTMVVNGSYGDTHASASRLIVYGESIDDKMTFYINDTKTTTVAREFDSAAIKRADLVIPTSSKPTLAPTPEPTTLAPTPEPTTLAPTPEPTTIPTTIATISPTPTPTPVPIPVINNTTIKFLGVLLISIAICVAGALITYFILTKKMKRDDEEDIIL